MKYALFTLALAALTVACETTPPEAQDTNGNYATTSEFRSLEREELVRALETGVMDVDARQRELEARASTLGEDAVEELYDHLDDIAEARTETMNEIAELKAALHDDWEDHRDDAIDAFESLRGELDDAYDEVFDETT
jgi:hypothetical protein